MNQENGTGVEPEPGNDATRHASVHKVFETQELLEIILGYALTAVHQADLRQNDEIFSNVRNIRLVQRKWKDTAVQLMFKNKEPFHKLILKEINPLNMNENEPSELLNQFVSFWKACNMHRNRNAIDTISVCIERSFMREDNFRSFKNFLHQCGQGLVKLQMDIPPHAGTLPGNLPFLKLPNLRDMLWEIECEPDEMIEPDDEELRIYQREEYKRYNPSNQLTLMQSLLNGSSSLEKIKLKMKTRLNDPDSPAGYEYLGLPASVAYVDISGDGQNELNVLKMYELPNLSILKIQIHSHLSSHLLQKVLSKVQNKLQCLVLYPSGKSFLPGRPNFVNFPEMKSLREVIFSHPKLQLDDTGLQSLATRLPKLEKLTLACQTNQTINKWCSGPPLSTVKYLAISVANIIRNEYRNEAVIVPLPLETMQNVCRTFSNVQFLMITVSGTETNAIKLIFKEMCKLKSLYISFFQGEQDERVRNPNLWDSILTGLPVSRIAFLKKYPLSQTNVVKDDILEGSQVSIQNLTELTTLGLEGNATYPEESLITGLSFILALNKMPNLVNLNLRNQFQVSEAIKRAWESKGGTITDYSVKPSGATDESCFKHLEISKLHSSR